MSGVRRATKVPKFKFPTLPRSAAVSGGVEGVMSAKPKSSKTNCTYGFGCMCVCTCGRGHYRPGLALKKAHAQFSFTSFVFDKTMLQENDLVVTEKYCV